MADKTRSFAPEADAVRPVSKRTDRAEREADEAADAVVRGRSVSRGSLSRPAVGQRASVQRQETGAKPKTDEEKKLEALSKVGEAALETKPVKALKEKVLEDPGVKKITDAMTSPVGIGIGLAAVGAGVTGLALAGKELPFQAPEIPLDWITPGLSGKVTATGPMNNPTFVGLAITYKEQPAKDKKGKPSASERFRDETARLAAEQEAFRSNMRFPAGSKEAEERRLTQEAINYVVSQQTRKLGIPGLSGPAGLVLPLNPREAKKKEEPVQRAPASTSDTGISQVSVDRAVGGGGRPLDDPTRRKMETRFGHDFSAVRIHDDATASSTSASIDAAAFTVGNDIAFGGGRFSTSSPQGVHLLAHELAHVVQTDGQARVGAHHPPTVHRKFQLGVLLGLSEGTWQERELRDYLAAITDAGAIDGAYDADNKARAIVRLWKASTAGWDLTPAQKVLLIREMLDGPTLHEDEAAIIDLLELSDASDLRSMLGTSEGITYAEIEADVNGPERVRLRTWVNSRFRDGREALLEGRVEVLGPAVPSRAPNFGFDGGRLDRLFDSHRTRDELIEILDAYTDQDRMAALRHLTQVRRPRQVRGLRRLRERLLVTSDQRRIDAITSVGRRRRLELIKTEQVVLHYMLQALPGSEADLISQTSASDSALATDIDEALRPELARPSATFVSTLPNESNSYEDKLTAQLPGEVDKRYQRLVGNKGRTEHDDSSRTRELSEFETIGNVSRDETLRVFGPLLTNPAPALRADTRRNRGNIHDGFTEFEREHRRRNRRQRRENARRMVLYFFQSDTWVRRLNRAHDAAPQFDDRDRPTNDEARAQQRVSRAFVRDPNNVRRLNEIERNWPGTQLDGHITVQIFRGDTPESDRLGLWEIFQTLIHEYLHALAHGLYDDYAQTFGTSSNEYNTLMEGVDSLLTEIVWEAVEPRLAQLRASIEGAEYSHLPAINVPHASVLSGRYPSYTEALRLVDIVGIENVYAAYFVGLVDRIGGPARSGP
jgi:hypothetical protein